jgi:pimeloyl-ACP methyl ester carboxylesterase
LHAVDLPTLVIAGDGDRITPQQRAHELVALLPHTTLHMLTGCGTAPRSSFPRK